MTRDDIGTLMTEVLTRRGRPPATAEGQSLREAGFRSLDFSELALRLEMAAGRELSFDAAAMRRIETVGDVLDFFDGALR